MQLSCSVLGGPWGSLVLSHKRLPGASVLGHHYPAPTSILPMYPTSFSPPPPIFPLKRSSAAVIPEQGACPPPLSGLHPRSYSVWALNPLWSSALDE